MFRSPKNSIAKASGSPKSKLAGVKDFIKSSILEADLELKVDKWTAPNAEVEQLSRNEREVEMQRIRTMKEIEQLQKSVSCLARWMLKSNSRAITSIRISSTERSSLINRHLRPY